MKKTFYYLFSIMAILLGVFSCGDEPEVSPYPPGSKYKRTVMVYMAAQNSLGASGFARQDSAEMANGMRYLLPGERVLMFLDDDRAPRLYELRKGLSSPQLVKQWKEDLNSADPKTLTELLTTMRTDFTSESYGLVLWSHATGWIPSPRSVSEEKFNVPPHNTTASAAEGLTSRAASSVQNTSLLTRNDLWLPEGSTADANAESSSAGNKRTTTRKNPAFSAKSYGMDVGKNGNWERDVAALGAPAEEINIDDLSKAIAAANIPLRFIHMDCCLMGDIQAFYALRHAADYIAASPIEISAIGGFYTDMLRWGYFSEEIKDLGITYSNYYVGKGSQPYTDNFGLVFAIVRTDKLQAVADAMAAELPQHLPALKADGSKNFPDMTDTQTYGRYTSNKFWRPHYYDMNDALRRALPTDSWQRVKQALDAATVYKFTTPRFMTGLTVLYQGNYTADVIAVDEANFCGISMFVPQEAYTIHAVSNPPYWNRACPHGDLNKEFRKTEWYTAAGWKAAGW